MAPAAAHQAGTGSIAGRAVARDGGAAPGVNVTVTGVGVRRTTVTDAKGRFAVDALPPGVYQLLAELAGFRRTVVAALKVEADRATDANPVMRPGILGDVLYVAPRNGIRGALLAADIVVHLRVVKSLRTGLLGPDQIILATEHAVTILGVVKSPATGLSPGDSFTFWQHMAGEWQEENGHQVRGPEQPYRAGQEFVAFLQDDPQWGRSELAGPQLMFAVEDGVVSWRRPEEAGLRNGMAIDAFLARLRELLQEPR
jgi:hypothetical protein